MQAPLCRPSSPCIACRNNPNAPCRKRQMPGAASDRVEYVGKHTVVGRAKLEKVLNPAAASSRATYLRAEVSELADSDAKGATQAAEQELRDTFCTVVDLQAQLDESPRLPAQVKDTASFARGSAKSPGLWGSIRLWQGFLRERAAGVAEMVEMERQRLMLAFMSDPRNRRQFAGRRGSSFSLDELPAPLAAKIRSLEQEAEMIEAPEADPDGALFHSLLEVETHRERLQLFQEILSAERKRLAARLKSHAAQ